jgi:hypothetical protein
VTKLATDYGIGLKTMCDIKNKGSKWMKFARNSSSDAGTSKH